MVKKSLSIILNGISCDMLWNIPTTDVLYSPSIPAPDTVAVMACNSAMLISAVVPITRFASLYTLKWLITSGKTIPLLFVSIITPHLLSQISCLSEARDQI